MWSPFNKTAIAVACLLAAAQAAPLDPRSSIKIDFPGDSPVTLLSADVGESRATARGGAMVLDLRMALLLRNAGSHRIRGVTILVTAQEVTPGGKGSVAVPSLDVAPGESFPLRIDLQLLRPLQPGSGPLVHVSLDGVLFHDFSFYGPNRLDSKRSLTVWELEAQRDRQYFKSILQAYGPQGLQRAALDSLERQAARPRLDVQVARGGRSTSAAAGGGERQVQFAFLQFPDSPIEPVRGVAQIAGHEARSPHIQVRNRSKQAVRHYEIGWIVKDREGKEFWAATVPASDPDAILMPGQQGSALQNTSLRFLREQGTPLPIQSMMGFVSQVEFADGKVWVPDRQSLENAQLLRVLAPSPEEQRLSDLYRKKGLSAMVEELKKY